ncbi:hypothetical protein V1478_013140, partial [Vespula squamosa]
LGSLDISFVTRTSWNSLFNLCEFGSLAIFYFQTRKFGLNSIGQKSKLYGEFVKMELQLYFEDFLLGNVSKLPNEVAVKLSGISSLKIHVLCGPEVKLVGSLRIEIFQLRFHASRSAGRAIIAVGMCRLITRELI